MSSRMSDNPAHRAPAPTPSLTRRPWFESLRANLSLPLAMLLLIPFAWLFERPGADHYHYEIVVLVGFNIILAVSLQLINGFSGQFSLGHAGFMAVGAYLAAYPAMNLSKRFTDPAACLIFFLSLGVVVAIVGVFLLALFLALRQTRKIHSS